jgi:prepilin-type N-terminal cleavage/methylation domain-containing protein
MKLIKRTSKFATPAAYTLVEVIVAVLILAVMLISLYGGFSSGFAVVKLARENLRATQIMMQKMETVRLLKWTQLLDTNNFLQPAFQDYYDPSATNANAYGATYRGFVSTNAATGISPDYAANMRAVTVTIYWTNYPRGITNTPIVRLRQMQTLVAKYGMQNYVYK